MTTGIIGYVKVKREPVTPPTMTAPSRNVRPLVRVSPQEAPDPPRQGDTPSRPAKVQVATFQNVAAILSVMRDNFIPGGIYAPQFGAAVNYSHARGQGSKYVAPWMERTNIVRLEPRAYGSGIVLTDEDYNLMMGAN